MKTFTTMIPAQLALEFSNDPISVLLEDFLGRFNSSVKAAAICGSKQFPLNLGIETDDYTDIHKARDLLVTLASQQGYKVKVNDQHNITVFLS